MLIWMAAAENDALPGCKVGGVGDVLRDLPPALAEQGHRVVVFTPAYGRYHRVQGARRVASIRLKFGGRMRVAALYRIGQEGAPVTQYVIEHGLITAGKRGKIYFDDGPSKPFASDACRFSFFSAAIAAWMEQAEAPPDIMHVHDWHLGALFFLRRFDRAFGVLRRTRCVFSIHNLAYQGIRPLAGHPSSLETWFPGTKYVKREVVDPRFSDCVNLMGLAIRQADGINTVSPGYAKEILLPSDPSHGFVGGEGLEQDLQEADSAGRLVGILNGCTYPAGEGRKPSWKQLRDAIACESGLSTGAPGSPVKQLPVRRPFAVLTSVGRITAQKSTLFLQETKKGVTALDAILQLAGPGFIFVMLGSGDAEFERRFDAIARRRRNFVFLRGYAEKVSRLLYRTGDLFLMPSSFEPCGISQMLAMRDGQPCVVHSVGGLRDTVRDGHTGFQFRGRNPQSQARQFVSAVARALAVKHDEPQRWKSICGEASAQRFTWAAAAREYVVKLYAS